ncbi:unnamed protein product [Paramecium primaurelia]|uniref:SET domain-containing protein n=1 Tax=Paramecium primaurelia TaxID=5886 RepID=A0A8S1KXU1_PARPR|nr:unnamed protein product [Paramecium primaurelia]
MMVLKACMVAITLFLSFCQDDSEYEGKSKPKRQTYEDPDPYKNLIQWLKDGKAEISKVQIEVKSEGYRTLRATQFIRQGEWVLFIPRTHYLSLDEVKKSCLINRKMIQINYKPNNIQTYFVNHLLQENRRQYSFWKPYIDVLPKDVSGFPTYFDAEQDALLKGSPTLFTVINQRKVFKEEYENLKEAVKEFQKYGYTYNDFIKFRILTISRSFTVQIGDKEQQQLLVPLADFLNHDNNGFLQYGYSKDADGFFMQAVRNIQKGEELFYNYGQWSNKYFFMNYGFASLTNPMNQFDFDICLNKNDRLFNLKIQLTKGNMCWGNRLVNETDHDTFRQSLATVRFTQISKLDDFLQLEEDVEKFKQFWPGWHTTTKTIELEKATFKALKELLVIELGNFASTIEDDQRRLNDPKTPEFRKHIIMLTMREKQIIKKNIDVCDQMLQVIDKNSEELKNLMKYYQYKEITRFVNSQIIPMKIEQEGIA